MTKLIKLIINSKGKKYRNENFLRLIFLHQLAALLKQQESMLELSSLNLVHPREENSLDLARIQIYKKTSMNLFTCREANLGEFTGVNTETTRVACTEQECQVHAGIIHNLADVSGFKNYIKVIVCSLFHKIVFRQDYGFIKETAQRNPNATSELVEEAIAGPQERFNYKLNQRSMALQKGNGILLNW